VPLPERRETLCTGLGDCVKNSASDTEPTLGARDQTTRAAIMIVNMLG